MRLFSVVVMLCVAGCHTVESDQAIEDYGESAIAIATSTTAQGIGVAATTGWGDDSVIYTTNAAGQVSWQGGKWYVEIPVSFGTLISSATVQVRDNGPNNGLPTGISTIDLELRAQGPFTSRLLATTSSSGSGSSQTLTMNLSTPATIQAGEMLILQATPLTGEFLAQNPSMIGEVQVGVSSGGGPGNPQNIENRMISPLKGVASNHLAPWTVSEGMVSITNHAWHVPLDDLVAGDVISRVCATILDHTGSTVEMEIFRDRIGISSGVLGSPAIISSNGSFTVQTLCQNNVAHVVQDMEAITVRFLGVGSNPVRIGTVRFEIQHPIQ